MRSSCAYEVYSVGKISLFLLQLSNNCLCFGDGAPLFLSIRYSEKGSEKKSRCVILSCNRANMLQGIQYIFSLNIKHALSALLLSQANLIEALEHVILGKNHTLLKFI